MAIEICVFTRPDRMLKPEQWQRNIAAAQFPQTLDTEFDIEQHQGYVECFVEDHESGFEYSYERLEETAFPADMREVFEPDTVCVKLSVPAGSPRERIASALMAASVLAKSTDGIMWRDTGFIEEPDPVEWVRGWLAEQPQLHTSANH